ncbi:hypothetical protein BDB01DRAFT_834495 [Pilobolus umbonatus]|nr:hypothetical protein BDB01DRAFT_834495 [Pilobolus umbonatus]
MQVCLLLLFVGFIQTISATPAVLNPVCLRDLRTSGFFLSQTKLTFAEASKYCKEAGAQLADVNTANIQTAASVTSHCLGPQGRVWVHSWDGNDYLNTPLALVGGPQPSSGTIHINDQGNLFALCEGRYHPTPIE